MTKVTSQKGIVFIQPTALIRIIDLIEDQLPGWWWSISQRPAQIALSAGPSKHSPHAHDVVLATTAEAGSFGDAGLIHTLFYPEHKSDESLLQFTRDLITLTAAHRAAALSNTSAVEAAEIQKGYRKQSRQDLADLESKYIAVLSDIESLETPGYLFDEVYLGSCELSVDCSLRGTKPDGSEFDFSWDLHHQASIADSLAGAHEEIKDAIKAHLTIQKKGETSCQN